MPTSPSLRVATVGTGYFSRFQYAAWKRIKEVELVAVCNRSIGPAEELAEYYQIPGVYQDFEQMLDTEKPDLVDIITPPETHSQYVRAAVKRNIPVICQKPFTPSYKEAKELVDFIEEEKAKVIIHENFRFQPWYKKIKKILDQNLLGEIYQLTFSLRPGDGQGPNAYLDRQPYFQKMERLLVHETAVHFIDVFRYLLGDVSSIFADLRRVNPVIKGEDAGLIIFEFENGARGLFDGNRASDHNADNCRLTMGEMRIEGEKGTLSLNGNAELFYREHGKRFERPMKYGWTDCDFGGDCVYNFQRHVIDHLVDGTEVMNSAKEYLSNVELTEAAYFSNDSGKRIQLGGDKIKS